jgi:transcriptional regulator with XRE-family HTH domain
MIAHPFSELEAKMDPKRLARSNERVRRIIAGMLIAELRRHTGKTQSELADLIGVKQPVISRMEMQDDLRLSTLQTIVNALGGSLHVTAKLPGGEIELPPAVYEPRQRGAKSPRKQRRHKSVQHRRSAA